MSNQNHRIRPELRFSPARSGDEVYYIVEDHHKHRFWKIGLLEYEVCSVLNGTHPIPVAAALLAKTSRLGVEAGVDKLTAIGMWLMQIGLVEAVGPAPDDAAAKPNTPAPARLFDPSFFRIPVLTSEAIDRACRGLTWLISIPCFVAAIAVWCIAGIIAVQNGAQLMALGAKLFVPGSQWWLLVAWLMLKAVHENRPRSCNDEGRRQV